MACQEAERDRVRIHTSRYPSVRSSALSSELDHLSASYRLQESDADELHLTHNDFFILYKDIFINFYIRFIELYVLYIVCTEKTMKDEHEIWTNSSGKRPDPTGVG